MKRNIARVSQIVSSLVEGGKFLQSCFEWESKPRTITAFIVSLLLQIPISKLYYSKKNNLSMIGYQINFYFIFAHYINTCSFLYCIKLSLVNKFYISVTKYKNKTYMKLHWSYLMMYLIYLVMCTSQKDVSDIPCHGYQSKGCV